MRGIDRESLNIRLQFMWNLFCMITACVITVMGILALLGTYDAEIPNSVLWQIPAVAIVLSVISSFIYPFHRAMGKVEKRIRIFAHYILVCIIAMMCGNVFYWYDISSVRSIAIMFSMVSIIFIVVSVMSWKKSDAEAKSLNSGLKKMQGEDGER